MKEQELRQEITKAVKKGWIKKGGFHTDIAVDEVYKMIIEKFCENEECECIRIVGATEWNTTNCKIHFKSE